MQLLLAIILIFIFTVVELFFAGCATVEVTFQQCFQREVGNGGEY